MRIFLILLIGWLFTQIAYSKQLEIDIAASSAILVNADSGVVLFEKNAHAPRFPASVTKIATALFVLDQKKPALETEARVSGEALRMKQERGSLPHWLEGDGTMMGLSVGEIVSYEALLHGLLMVSGNDAANVLGESLSGTVPDFMKEMNAYLHRLGCLRTQYLNPHGLHDPEHVTTAYDISLMVKRGLEISKFREIFSKISYDKPKTNKHGKGELIHSYPQLKPGANYYSKVIGGKTGYTSKARASLASAATYKGRTLIGVILDSPKGDRYGDMKKMFETAFQEVLEKKILVSSGEVFTKIVEGGKTALSASLREDLAIEYYSSEEPECRAFIHWDPKQCPIQKGERVGEIRLVDLRGEVIRVGELVAKNEVKPKILFQMKRYIGW